MGIIRFNVEVASQQRLTVSGTFASIVSFVAEGTEKGTDS
jgi:hypothetical protein